MEELVRLRGEDYDEFIDFLDLVFSQAGRPHFFERSLPRMCRADDEHMGKHFAIRVNGRIVSLLGVYPLPVVIGGERFTVATTGNVATHHRYEGRGYAHRLLQRALEEHDRLGADAARLTGFRQRYNRFGFEAAGTVYTAELTAANVKGEPERTLRFAPIEREDRETLARVQALQTAAPFYADRGDSEGFYLAATAWRNTPYAAYDGGGRLVGCLSASPDGCTAAELLAGDGESAVNMAVQWLRQGRAPSLRVSLPPWDLPLLRRMSGLCQALTVESPSMFRIIRWQRLADALCRLRSQLSPLPEGEFTLAIGGGPRLHFTCREGQARCTEGGGQPQLTLDPLAATRLIFGPQPPWTVAPVPGALAAALLPLPLSWCGQDRV